MDLSFLLNAENLQKLLEVLTQAGVILGALLSILGGLKVLARYTSSEADDKALAAVENLLLKIKNLAANLLPKGKE
jgi:hypothetical protein